MQTQRKNIPVRILLADDDQDDRFFFKLVTQDLLFPVALDTVEDGIELMEYLTKHIGRLPDVLFLDLNMPRKNGAECLAEIKANPKMSALPVIIYSTSLHEDVAEILYLKGAHYYIRKTDILELKKILNYILGLMTKNNFARPKKDKFILKLNEGAENNKAGN